MVRCLGMENPVRKTLVSALTAGLVVLMAPAAHAATRDLTDPTGDVMTATADDDGNITYHREHGAEGDITFARIQHTATQVVVYLRYAQLSVPKQYGELDYELEGNNGWKATVDIETRHGDPQGYVTAQNNKGKRCRVAYRINYAGDSSSMRIPRGCLHSSKYVRLMHVTATYQETQTGPFTVYYDSPSRDGGTINQINASRTPWVVTG